MDNRKANGQVIRFHSPPIHDKENKKGVKNNNERKRNREIAEHNDIETNETTEESNIKTERSQKIMI